jgi:hypothetical protein
MRASEEMRASPLAPPADLHFDAWSVVELLEQPGIAFTATRGEHAASLSVPWFELSEPDPAAVERIWRELAAGMPSGAP